MKKIVIAITLLTVVIMGIGAEDVSGAKAGHWYIGANLLSGDIMMEEGIQYAPTGFSFNIFQSKSGDTANTYNASLALNLNVEAGYLIFDGFEIGLVTFLECFYITDYKTNETFTLLLSLPVWKRCMFLIQVQYGRPILKHKSALIFFAVVLHPARIARYI